MNFKIIKQRGLQVTSYKFDTLLHCICGGLKWQAIQKLQISRKGAKSPRREVGRFRISLRLCVLARNMEEMIIRQAEPGGIGASQAGAW